MIPLRTGFIKSRSRSVAFTKTLFLRQPALLPQIRCRFLSDKSPDNAAEDGKADSQKNDSKALLKKDTASNEVQKKDFNPLPSAPAEFLRDSGIEMLLKKDNKPYIPKLEYKRESFEYPGLPNEDEFTKYSNKIEKRKQVTRWTRYIPKILTAVVLVWGVYAVKVWYLDADEDAEQNDLLSPLEFHKFVITHKQKIDDEHYLVEVMPTSSQWQYSTYAHYERKSIWDGDKMWSVEIKQPQIMVVRSYTPLPLYFLKSSRTRSGEEEPLLKVIDNGEKDMDHGGVMLFYIKRYGDGEVSRYILDKKVGDELEIRGPHVDYTFPFHPLKQHHTRPTFRDLPSKIEAETLLKGIKREYDIPEVDTVDFYAAGTGIAPILQVLFSRNPYRGFVNVHYSARKDGELGPMDRFLFFLEKVDRIKLIKHIDDNPKTRLSANDVTKPAQPLYVSQQRQENIAQIQESTIPASESKKDEKLSRESLKKRLAILEGEGQKQEKKIEAPKEHAPYFENALAQAKITLQEVKPPAALSLVCGPDGFVEYVAGGKALETGEQGDVRGLLGSKGWDSTNVFKL
ncbi:hypothetical protein PUMCH_003334 [Australozyma saopauloensis]|uniref:FAD-binding FR-type domain-containing protein n=1 Tax=Australozyma saopauloensis TaxID=291208 RepID=A0AAX4HDP1_9ASCO|nr:hypothetical protein PUMCH_003334 [[Candida] saopauloensis]